MVATDTLELVLLEHTQQFDLSRRADLADLVQEECPAIRFFKAADASTIGAREGTALMPEELAFEQRFGECRAVQLDEGLLGARTRMMNRGGNHLLACP